MGIHSFYLLIITALIFTYLLSIHPPPHRWVSRVFSAVARGTAQTFFGKVEVPYLPRAELIQALHLLRIGDSFGAELTCQQSLSKQQVSESNSFDKNLYRREQKGTIDHSQKAFSIDILICLGEARLMLHQQSYESLWNRLNSKHLDSAFLDALVNTQLLSSFDKLQDAKSSFEAAVLLDPMNPRARAGLGLSLLLLATRFTTISAIGDDESLLEQSDLDSLFDATSHLNAAVTMIENGEDKFNNDVTSLSIFHPSDRMMHLTSLYNLALAHLAMGDYIASMHVLKRVLDLLSHESMLDPTHNYRTVSIPSINLIGVLISLGQTNEALDLLIEMDVVGYCSSQERITTTIDSMIYMNLKPFEYLTMKICMIILNNRDLAIELKTFLGVNITKINNSSLYGDKLYEIPSKLNELFIKIDDMRDSLGFAIVNHNRFTGSGAIGENEKQLSTTKSSTIPIHERSRTSVQLALESMEYAARSDPSNSRLWLSLTRAKLVAGDFVGAVDAAAAAVNVANGLDEIEVASRNLEQALERLLQHESKDQFNETRSFGLIIPMDDAAEFGESFRLLQYNETEVQSLRSDILTLQLQLLQKDSFISSQQRSLQEMSSAQQKDNEHKGCLINSLDSATVEVNQLKIHVIQPNRSMLDMTEHDLTIVSNLTKNVEEKLQENNFTESAQSDVDASLATISVHPDQVPHSTPVDNEAPIYEKEKKLNVFGETSTSNISSTPEIDEESNEVIELPVLFKPEIIVPTNISPTALSYMKIADALMEKNQFQQAAKQFSKVLKRHSDHLPALLGYATAYERSSNSNQLEDVSTAYLHATQVALSRGSYDLADVVMRRAIEIALLVSNRKRIVVLKQLLNYSHTDTIAAEISFEIGRVFLSQNDTLNDARDSFHLANALIVRETGNSSECHARSSLELGKIALDKDSNYSLAILFLEKALSRGLGQWKVEGLVRLGRSKSMAGDTGAAEATFMEAIDLPTTESSAQAHYLLGLLLMNRGGDNELIEKHFITALNLGLDITKEITEILGEYHIAVLKSVNRAKRREYEDSFANDSRTGGVLGGGSLSDKSIFKKSQENPTAKSETLTILEQGAASYDGQTHPDGDEMGDMQSANLHNKRRSQQVTI